MENIHFINYKNSKIAYHVYGQGKEPVFCLHGFSLSGISYAGLGKYCSKDKIMFALDFPLHGETEWTEKGLTAKDLLTIFELIASQELSIILQDFVLIAHSMGGRIALYMYQSFPEKISKLILMAPDALKMAFGHRFLFRTRLGPKIFRRLSNSSKFIMSLANFCRKVHLINRSVYNLIKSSYEDADTAHIVYERLIITHDFYPDMATIKKEILQYKTPVYLFFGKYDTIVPAGLAEHLEKGVEPFVHVKVLLSGHLLLANEDTLPEIADSMNN